MTPGRTDVRRAPARAVGRGPRERNIGVYLFLTAVALFSAAPLLVVAVNALRSNTAILTEPLGLPTSPEFSNFVRAWSDASLGRYMLNSLLVTAGTLVLGTAVSLPLAYGLGRWRFRGRWALVMLVGIGLMVPIRIGALPLYHFFESLGLVDSLLGLVLVYAASGIPLAVLVLSAFYRGLPDTLGDAARIDGAGEATVFWRIYTPLVRPAIATVVVLNVGPAWNDFFFPLILQRTPSDFVLPIGVSTFFGEYSADRGMLSAGLLIAGAPMALLFAVSMRQVVRGLTAGMER